jgi:ferredoxin-NADP reductase
VRYLPGQHYYLRLTAPDGYQASRAYSVASSPLDEQLEFYIARLPDGEVSSYPATELAVGDQLEVRGPIGGWFGWAGDVPRSGSEAAPASSPW